MMQTSKGSVGCVVITLLPVALLAGLTERFWNWERHILPAKMTVDVVLASNSENGFIEGCQAAVYRLSAATADAIKREGLAYFERAASPAVESKTNPYGSWRTTPGDVDIAQNGRGAGSATIYGLYVMSGCANGGDPAFLSKVLVDSWSRPGSYFTVTRNREGVIIVDPNKRLAAYYYFG